MSTYPTQNPLRPLPGQTLDGRGRAVPILSVSDLLRFARQEEHAGALRAKFRGLDLYADQTQDLERELDRIWPGWRRYQPIPEDLDPGHRARIQWLLKRRDLLWVQGRDWGVYLAVRADRPGRVYAHPIEPPHDPAQSAEYRRRRDLFCGPAYEPPATSRPSSSPALAIARSMNLSPAAVEAALQGLPPGSNPEIWVKHKLLPGGSK